MQNTIESRVSKILEKVALVSTKKHIVARDYVDFKQKQHQNKKHHELFVKHLNYASKMFDKKYKKYFTGDKNIKNNRIIKKIKDFKNIKSF